MTDTSSLCDKTKKFLDSAEGQRAIRKAIASWQKHAAFLCETRRLTPAMRREPFTL